MPLHEDLARMVVNTGCELIGDDTRRALLATVIDTVGCAAASAGDEFAADAIKANVALSGRGPCSVIGRADRLAPVGAAMLNGTLAHGYDFDDVHLPSVGHLSTAVIPAALAACELVDAGGSAFLDAVLVGDEVGGRIGWAACAPEWGGSAIRTHGSFPTAILGTMGAAAAVAKILRLGESATAQALAIAASYAAGLACISRGDNSTKRTQAGWAAQSGLAAALLAREGFTGPQAVLETRQGFFEAFTGNNYRAEALQRQPGMPWVCEEMSFKYYPLEYIIHPLVEMASKARGAIGGRLDTIVSIEASTTSRFITLFEPQASKVSPADRFMALISAPYCIARALTKPGTGELFLRDFQQDYVLDDEVRALAMKVRFGPNPELDAVFPHHVAGELTVRGAGGAVLWQGRIEDVYGSLQRPLSETHLIEKFHANCSGLAPGAGTAILEALGNLPSAKDAQWIAKLRGSAVE